MMDCRPRFVLLFLGSSLISTVQNCTFNRTNIICLLKHIMAVAAYIIVHRCGDFSQTVSSGVVSNSKLTRCHCECREVSVQTTFVLLASNPFKFLSFNWDANIKCSAILASVQTRYRSNRTLCLSLSLIVEQSFNLFSACWRRLWFWRNKCTAAWRWLWCRWQYCVQ